MMKIMSMLGPSIDDVHEDLFMMRVTWFDCDVVKFEHDEDDVDDDGDDGDDHDDGDDVVAAADDDDDEGDEQH